MAVMTFINLTAILLLSRFAFQLLDDFEQQYRRGISPKFEPKDFPDLHSRIDDDVWIKKKALEE